MMTIQGHECSDKKVIAEQFNIYFATKGMQNVHRDNAHDRHSFRNYLTHETENYFSFHMIDKKCYCSHDKKYENVTEQRARWYFFGAHNTSYYCTYPVVLPS